MKKYAIIGIMCVMLLSLAGCVNKEKQKAVLEYINTTSVPLMEREKEMLDSYSSVIGARYTDDVTLYMELMMNTIPMATKLKNAAVALTQTITDEELLEVHNLYVTYITEFLDALNLMAQAVDEQNKTIIAEANVKLNNANAVTTQFREGIQKLTDKYKIQLESK